MADYSVVDLMNAVRAAGFSGMTAYVMGAVSLAENTSRKLLEVNTAGNTPVGSRDRGPFMINDYWHPDVTDQCAFDLNCAAKAAYKISGGGTTFSAWTTYRSGAYLSHLSEVQGVASTPSSSAADSSTNSVTATPASLKLGPLTIPTPSDVRKIVLTGVFVAGGVAMIVMGGWVSTGTVRRKVADAASAAAPTLETAAV